MLARLYRSRTDKMLGGVCGGLGEYLGIDSTLVRLFFVLLTLARGVGLLIYLGLWVITPRRGQGRTATVEQTIRSSADEIARRARSLGDEVREAARGPQPQARLIIGAVLTLSGVVFLLQNLNFPWMWWLGLDVLWPALLIMAGVLLLLRGVKGG